MLYFILGMFFGVMLMFCARLADKDITLIVDGYKGFRSVKRKKPIIVLPTEDEEVDEFGEYPIKKDGLHGSKGDGV